MGKGFIVASISVIAAFIAATTNSSQLPKKPSFNFEQKCTETIEKDQAIDECTKKELAEMFLKKTKRKIRVLYAYDS